ncbi:unnamed protein product [Vitrella brassicaformis CCMP3155]|uniref:Uncharacterized protein n=1 Tax=Vitrella brassicaformis (strain CCMP3155) TaxID=1169540 RepID=A0A0G4FX35_VITBC|nr:unnamed protein product [Vitrella brassicaformis CCMP3155]|eukprot:CEM19522.1 unnamed protein product [Vitrella brassicaformis CCMP3155]
MSQSWKIGKAGKWPHLEVNFTRMKSDTDGAADEEAVCFIRRLSVSKPHLEVGEIYMQVGYSVMVASALLDALLDADALLEALLGAGGALGTELL